MSRGSTATQTMISQHSLQPDPMYYTSTTHRLTLTATRTPDVPPLQDQVSGRSGESLFYKASSNLKAKTHSVVFTTRFSSSDCNMFNWWSGMCLQEAMNMTTDTGTQGQGTH